MRGLKLLSMLLGFGLISCASIHLDEGATADVEPKKVVVVNSVTQESHESVVAKSPVKTQLIGGVSAPTMFDYSELDTLTENDPRITSIVNVVVKDYKNKPKVNISMPNIEGNQLATKIAAMLKKSGVKKIHISNADLSDSATTKYHLDKVMVMIIFHGNN